MSDKYENASEYFHSGADALYAKASDKNPTYTYWAADLEYAAGIIDELLAAQTYRETVASPILSVTEREAAALLKAAKLVEDLNIQPKSGDNK